MRSFAQHVSFLRVDNLADTAFTLMASRGVDPRRFVEWYTTEGILFNEDDAPEQSKQWLQQELLLVEGFGDWWKKNMTYDNIAGAGQAVGTGVGHLAALPGAALAATGGAVRGAVGTGAGHLWGGLKAGLGVGGGQNSEQPVDLAPYAVGPGGQGGGQQGGGQQQAGGGQDMQQQFTAAHQALSNLSKNLPDDLKKNNGFAASLQALIGMLSNPQQIMKQQAPATPAPTPAPATAPQTAHYDPSLDSPFLTHILVEHKARRVCNKLVEHGYDPRMFVNWYIAEGRYMSPEVFEGNVGDFFGNLWGGVKNMQMFGGQGFSHGWNQAKIGRFKDAAVNALMALQGQAQNLSPDFNKHMQTVLQVLQGLPSAPADGSAGGGILQPTRMLPCRLRRLKKLRHCCRMPGLMSLVLHPKTFRSTPRRFLLFKTRPSVMPR